MVSAIIIHGWGAEPSSDWFPFLKKELSNKKYEVLVPEMPNADEPSLDSWVDTLKKLDVDESTCLIGHSIGCRTILHYLQDSDKVKKVILVAPWLNINEENLEDEELEIAKPWVDDVLDFDKIKNKAEFVVVYSENDPFHLMGDVKKLIEVLNAEEINLGEKGHINKEDGVTELPELLRFF